MPLSRYDTAFGGKKGSAGKAKRAMAKQYGAKKGESVFYASVNKAKKKRHSAGQEDMVRQFMKRRRRGG